MNTRLPIDDPNFKANILAIKDGKPERIAIALCDHEQLIDILKSKCDLPILFCDCTGDDEHGRYYYLGSSGKLIVSGFGRKIGKYFLRQIIEDAVKSVNGSGIIEILPLKDNDDVSHIINGTISAYYTRANEIIQKVTELHNIRDLEVKLYSRRDPFDSQIGNSLPAYHYNLKISLVHLSKIVATNVR